MLFPWVLFWLVVKCFSFMQFQMLTNQPFCFLTTETWGYYGNGFWWPLRYIYDVTLLNIHWFNLQRVLLYTIPVVFSLSIWVPWCLLQVCRLVLSKSLQKNANLDASEFLISALLFSEATTIGLIKTRDTYPFGVDPVWHGTRSELPFLNSLKMKMSILLGVAQMNLGIIMSFCNAKFFKSAVNIWWVYSSSSSYIPNK